MNIKKNISRRMSQNHLGVKLFITGLIASQALCMAQGYMTTTHTETLYVKASEAVVSDYAKPQVVLTGRRESEKEYAKRIISERVIIFFGKDHLDATLALVYREGGLNPRAQNPHSTAYGMFQFLDSTWKTVGCVKTTEITEQTECAMKYIEKRYGNPIKALEFRLKKGWY